MSLPEETAEQLVGLAEAAGAPSVSAYVTGAIQDRVKREKDLASLREVWGEPDPEGLAWAREALGVTSGQRTL